jgi:hypothetical protein
MTIPATEPERRPTMAGWEYLTIYYGKEASMKSGGGMIWTVQIRWPGVDRIDIRDEANIKDVLNELGEDGWELVSDNPGPGIHARDLFMKRQKLTN